MANKVEIQIVGNNVYAVNAIDGVKTKLGTLEKSAKSMSDRMMNHFKMIGGAFLAGGAFSFMQSAIDAYKQQEVAARKLDTALGRNSGTLQNYATALQKTTVFADELTVEAMSLFAAFIKDEEQIKKLTKATMDLATAKGMDLVSAADLVAKSVGSSTNALSRYGIQVEGAAGSTQRLEMAVKNITALYGGQAGAQGQTLSGQLDILSNQLNDQQEIIGEGLLPVWVALNQAGAGLISIFQDLSGFTMGRQLAEQQLKLEQDSKNLAGERFDALSKTFTLVQNTGYATIFLTEAQKKALEISTKTREEEEKKLEAIRKQNEEFQLQLTRASNKLSARGTEDIGGGVALEPMMQFYEMQKMMIDDVTDYELAALFLRSEAAAQTFGDMAGAMLNFYSMAGEGSRTFFDMYKIFAAGEAAIAAYDAATKVFAATAFMYPFNYVAAGAALTFGLSNVARILSMQPGSAPSGGGGTAPSIPRGSTINNNNSRNMNYQIVVYTSDPNLDKDRFARDIIGALRKAEDDGG